MQPDISNQNVEQTNQVTQASPLHQVTPLSKYLAMVLFIILPFVGGWIGYTFAPEKVVEVEVVKEVVVEENSVPNNHDNTSRTDTTKVRLYSDVLQEPNGYNPFGSDPENLPRVQNLQMHGIYYEISETSVIFKTQRLPETEVTVSGEFEISQNAQALAVQVIFRPDAESLQKLPWPATYREPITEYGLGDNQWGLNPSIICETKERCNELFTLLDNVERQTFTMNGTGTVGVLRQVVDDRRSEYDGPIPVGLIEFGDIKLQTNPFMALSE